MSDAGNCYMIRTSEHRTKLTAFLSAKIRAIDLNIQFMGEDTGIFWAIQPTQPVKIKHFLYG